jgi:hypothetical protein
MYWNNPLEPVRYPGPSDIIFKATHGGQHCLFWNPAARFDHIPTNQRLTDLCAWVKANIQTQGIDAFLTDSRCFYDIANLVKLNMWIQDIRQQGIVKPWLIQDPGTGVLQLGNGDSRLRCLERISEIQTVSAFVSTHVRRAHLYSDLEPVDTFEQFAQLCGAESGQEFLFRLTDANAPYGIDWYEYNSSRTQAVTPGEPQAVDIMVNYFAAHPGIEITPEWFDQLIDWSQYYPYS